MKALTIYQPWASLIALGLKGTETRGRGTRYRGPLVIHAGLRWDAELERLYYTIRGYLAGLGGANLPRLPLPLGAALAVSEVIDSIEVTVGNQGNQGMFTESDRVLGDCSVGRHVIVLGKPRPLRTPIPCRGAQGLWTVPPRLEDDIRYQIPDVYSIPDQRRRDVARDRKLEQDRGKGDSP
jgi:hypothetical protein